MSGFEVVQPGPMSLLQDVGRLGWQLVYGGGRAGLMGEVADAVAEVGTRMLAEAKLRDGFRPVAAEMRQIWELGVKRSLVE